MKYFPWIAIAFVAAAVIAAFFFIGSPAHQRLVRFDERRLSDLQILQYQVANYFTTQGKLPAALADMKGFEDFSVPLDPESRESYGYTVKGPRQFQLCANFALASIDQETNRPFPQALGPYDKEVSLSIWQHAAGRACFDITLEKPAAGADRTNPPAIIVKPAV